MKLFLAGTFILFFFYDVFPVSFKHSSRNSVRKRIYGFVNRFRRLMFDLAYTKIFLHQGERLTKGTIIAVTPRKIRIDFSFYC